MITIKVIKAYFPNAKEVKQIDSKQLFIVTYTDKKFLVSYKTIIGYKLLADNVWIITTQKFSQTTSKQTSQFINSLIRQKLDFIRVGESEFNSVLFQINANL